MYRQHCVLLPLWREFPEELRMLLTVWLNSQANSHIFLGCKPSGLDSLWKWQHFACLKIVACPLLFLLFSVLYMLVYVHNYSITLPLKHISQKTLYMNMCLICSCLCVLSPSQVKVSLDSLMDTLTFLSDIGDCVTRVEMLLNDLNTLEEKAQVSSVT